MISLALALLVATPEGQVSDPWRAELSSTFPFNTTAGVVSPSLGGTAYLTPLANDEGVPLGLLEFAQHPNAVRFGADVSTNGNSDAGMGYSASVGGDVYWKNTGVEVSAGISHASAITGRDPLREPAGTDLLREGLPFIGEGATWTMSASIAHYVQPHVRVEFGYAGAFDAASLGSTSYNGLRAEAQGWWGPIRARVEGDLGWNQVRYRVLVPSGPAPDSPAVEPEALNVPPQYGGTGEVAAYVGRRVSVALTAEHSEAGLLGINVAASAIAPRVEFFPRDWLAISGGYRFATETVSAGTFFSNSAGDIPLANFSRTIESHTVDLRFSLRL